MSRRVVTDVHPGVDRTAPQVRPRVHDRARAPAYARRVTRWERVLRWEERHRLAVDAALAALLALVAVPFAADLTYGDAGATAASFFLAAALVTPLAWRRVRPELSAALVYAAGLVQLALGIPLLLPADVAVLLALYSVTVHGSRWAYRLALWGCLAGTTVVAWSDGGGAGGAAFVSVFLWSITGSVWAFGLVRRSRRETLEALVDRAERLERERDQQAVIGAAAERARIAREMHDIVAHSLSVMIAQADGGRYAAAADPGAATRALGTIAETGRAALTDMRRLLGVLRADDAAAVDPGRLPAVRPGAADPHGVPAAPGTTAAAAVPTAPQPAADDVEGLVTQLRASGLRVSLVRLGTSRQLPPGAGLTIYRIAQESLTNVLKHAGPDPTVTVLLQWRPATVAVEVSDDGRGAAAGGDGLGQGLRGMRERAAMFGGTVTAGPRPGGGFRVRAELPTPDARGTAGAPTPAAEGTPA